MTNIYIDDRLNINRLKRITKFSFASEIDALFVKYTYKNAYSYFRLTKIEAESHCFLLDEVLNLDLFLTSPEQVRI